MEDLGHGVHRWTLRHPEWHPGEFGALVGSYLIHEGADTVIVDPLLDEASTKAIDDLIQGESIPE